MKNKKYNWAKNEVALLDLNCPYDRLCYESALKALKSLSKDEHSMMSIYFTKSILDRLIDGKPLSPITEENAQWKNCGKYNDDDDVKHYQSLRYGALFKDIHPDGTIVYHDVDRSIAFDPNGNEYDKWTGSDCGIVDEMFPITLPYMPEDKRYMVAVKDFSDIDDPDDYLKLFMYVQKPDGEKVEINQYVTYDKNGNKVILNKNDAVRKHNMI